MKKLRKICFINIFISYLKFTDKCSFVFQIISISNTERLHNFTTKIDSHSYFKTVGYKFQFLYLLLTINLSSIKLYNMKSTGQEKHNEQLKNRSIFMNGNIKIIQTRR